MTDYGRRDTSRDRLLALTTELILAVIPRRPARISREAGTLLVLKRLPSR